MIELKHHAEVSVAQDIAPGRRQIVDAIAFETNLARVGSIERGEQVQQRGLAAAARADDRDELALMHGQLDALQHRNRQRSLAITLANKVRRQNLARRWLRLRQRS